jgi:hypothetical protein
VTEQPDNRLVEETTTQALARLESTLAASCAAPFEEAVPAEMMQVFSDDQWPLLLFEFQPSMRIFSAHRDIVAVHRGDDVMEGDPPAGALRHWLIFATDKEQLVRPLDAEEHRAITMARSRKDFATMAAALWPQRDEEGQLSAMTELLLRWLAEGLVIDAGVPLPEDAEIVE